MTTTAYEDALQHLPSSGGARPTYSYYRQPNGWITASPATELEELKYRREGGTPLPPYGRFQFNTKYIADHPLGAVLMVGGPPRVALRADHRDGLAPEPASPPFLPKAADTVSPRPQCGLLGDRKSVV